MKSLFEKAIKYATEKHSGQIRKDGTIYILHPFEVATIVSTITKDEEVLTSALLHDVIEECDVDIEEITELFGKRVGKIVDLETEPKFSELSKIESWKFRKEEAIRRLEQTDDIGFKIVYLSDKLSNIRALYRDIQINGINAFNKFNISDIKEQRWYYYSILNVLKELNEFEAYKELDTKINYIFKTYGKELDNGKENYIL